MPASALVRSVALAALVVSVRDAGAETIYGYTNSGQSLVSFDSANPNSILTTATITGLNSGDSLRAIDFRSNGVLYGLGAQGRLYTLNRTTAVATQVGAGTFAVALSGASFGFDFDPLADQVHITSDTGRHMRVDPNTGAVIDGDGVAPGIQGDANLVYAPGDAHAGATPNAVGLACIGAPGSTLFRVLDFNQDTLCSLNASTGSMSTIGPTGINAQVRASLDYSQSSGVMYASMFLPGSFGATSLYTINLATGASTIVGAIGPGGGLQIDGISAVPIPAPGAAAFGLIALALGRTRGRRA